MKLGNPIKRFNHQKYLFNPRHLLWVLFFIPTINLLASDHVDGPINIEHAISDITDFYAFPSPEKPGHLILIANTHPFTPSSGHFSDRIHYDFLLRPAIINKRGSKALFEVGTESRISCQFETPKAEHEPHWVTCQSDQASSVRTQVNNTQSKSSDSGLRVFAGRRSDPFFANFDWLKAVSSDGIIAKPDDSNILANMNVLSIVLEINLAQYFGDNPPTLMALAVETLTQDSAKTAESLRRIDWLGRPEISNVYLASHKKIKEDLRDRYNKETPFDSSSVNRLLYQKRLHDSIKYYDALDTKQNWTLTMREHYVELLLNDYLVIDMSKPCNSASYFALEQAMLHEKTATSCGGRHPNDDVMDTIFTSLINANSGVHIRDGVNHPTHPSVAIFPYLANPDDSIWADIKATATRFLLN
jgi:hypothetical protein